jgi:hypothetical protein
MGNERTFDLRVTFPGKTPKQVERQQVEAGKKLKIMPDRTLEEIK